MLNVNALAQLEVLESLHQDAPREGGGLDAPLLVQLMRDGFVRHVGFFQYRVTDKGRLVIARSKEAVS